MRASTHTRNKTSRRKAARRRKHVTSRLRKSRGHQKF